jgi:hypothetical protein
MPMTTSRFACKPRTWGGFLALLLLCAPLLAQPQKPDADQDQFHPTRILAKFVSDEKARLGRQSTLAQQGLKVHRQFKLLPRTVVLDLADDNQAKAARALPPQARARALRDRITVLQASGLFAYVEPDYIRRLSAEPTDSAFVDGTLGPEEHRPKQWRAGRGHWRGGGLGYDHRLD